MYTFLWCLRHKGCFTSLKFNDFLRQLLGPASLPVKDVNSNNCIWVLMCVIHHAILRPVLVYQLVTLSCRWHTTRWQVRGDPRIASCCAEVQWNLHRIPNCCLIKLVLKKTYAKFCRERSMFVAFNNQNVPSLVNFATVTVWIAAQVHVHQQLSIIDVVINESVWCK